MKKLKVLIVFLLFFVNIEKVFAEQDVFLESNTFELELMIEDTNAFNDNPNRTLEYTYHDNKNNNGLWFNNAKDKDINYVNIKEYSDSKIVGDFVINSVSFENVKVNLTNYKGKIDAINGDKYLKGRISFKNSKYLSIIINSNINTYGLVGDFGKNNNLQLIDCLSKDFEVTNQDNRVLFESVTGIDKGIVAICKFEKLNADIGYVYLNNVSLSNKKEVLLNENVELKITEPKINDMIYHKLYNYVDNSKKKFNIWLFIFVIIVTIVIVLALLLFIKKIKKKKNKKKFWVLFLFTLFVPFDVFAINELVISNNDIIKVRQSILNNYRLSNNDKIRLDIDKDDKITINDLVVARISYNVPIINISDGTIEKDEKYSYYSNVNKLVEIKSLAKLKALKYCLTTDDYCDPNIDFDSLNKEHIMNVRFESNKGPQKLCVSARNIYNLENTKCDSKLYFVDNIKPELKIKNNKVYIGEDDEFDINSNVTAVYGVSGGKYKCEGKKDFGSNTIKCTIYGNNGLTSVDKYELIRSVTYKKNVIFFGDSITYGYANNGYGWGDYISNYYDFANVVNAGKSGWLISNYLNRDWLVDIVKTQKGNNYDYVIMQGGCNDINNDVPIGTYTNDNFSGNYDINTFLGGLEYYLYNVTNSWPNAKIGYIINYRTPNNVGRNDDKSAPYYKKMKEVLKKWKVNYLDLFDGKDSNGNSFSDILKVNTNEYLSDNLNLNNDGYEVIYPYIYNWMLTLK